MQNTKVVTGRKGQKGSKKYLDSFKRKVARHYLEGDLSMSQIAELYDVTRFQVNHWKRAFSSELSEEEITVVMTEQEQKELDALKKQNKQLKEKLDYEQMRTFALETMIDLAKEKLGVDVRKNFGAKQPEE